MKTYKVTWKHCKGSNKGIGTHNLKADSIDDAELKFLSEYPALYIHEVEEVTNA